MAILPDSQRNRTGHRTANFHRDERAPILFSDDFIPVESILPFEVWKDIDGYWGYQVSSWGKIGSLRKSGTGSKSLRAESDRKIMKPFFDRSEAMRVMLYSDGESIHKSVHSLVLTAFRGIADGLSQCRHLDGNPANNHISNLRWGTHTENMRDKALHGTNNLGLRNKNAKLKEVDIPTIYRRFHDGEPSGKLGREYGVSNVAIINVAMRKTWRHVAID